MDEFVLFLMFALACTFFIVGAVKRNMIFLGFSGVVLLLIGMFMFFGIQLPNGAIITTVGNTTTINDTSIAWGGDFKNPFAYVFTLTGLGLILFAAVSWYESPLKVMGDD